MGNDASPASKTGGMIGSPLDVNALAALAPSVDIEAMDGATLSALKLRVLDLIGCACAGFRIGTSRSLADALDTPGDACVWFSGARRAVADALRTNVFMSHSVYME